MANTDAKVGIAVCGQTILGTWWAYPPTPSLRLVGGSVDAILGNVGPAGIGLGCYPTKAFIGLPAGLGLAGVPPILAKSQTFAVPAAELDLATDLPEYVGAIWLHDVDCVELVGAAAECD